MLSGKALELRRSDFALAGLLVALWALFTDLAAGSWVIGVPAIFVSLLVSRRYRLGDIAPVNLLSLFRFVCYFLAKSGISGVDVARRALNPRVDVQPGYLSYGSRLRGQVPLTFFAYCVNLLPGTLVVRLHGTQLRVHALDTTADVHGELAAMEARVAPIFARADGPHDDQATETDA